MNNYLNIVQFMPIFCLFMKKCHICLILQHNRACYVVLPSVMNISLEIGTICSARQRVP